MSTPNALARASYSAGVIEKPRFRPAMRFEALCIPVTDGSSSMTWMADGGVTKGQAVNTALRGTFKRFQKSKHSASFRFGLIAFSDHAEVRMNPTPVEQIDDMGNYDPTTGLGNGTNIAAGLKKAFELGAPYLDAEKPGGVPRNLCLLLLTDGQDGCEEESRQLVHRIKNGPKADRITIATVYFQTLGDTTMAGRQFLHSLATSDKYTTDEHDPERIRDFFISSLTQSVGL